MFNFRKFSPLLFALGIALVACEKEIEPLTPPTEEIVPPTDGDEGDDVVPSVDKIRAFVVNEGQFGYGTASLTALFDSGKTQHDIFRKLNNRPMGDVAQSITKIDDRFYVPLNNSRKLEVFDSKTFQSIETMSIKADGVGLDVIPMYVQHLGGDSIAVTDQKMSSRLMIMDINHGKKRDVLRRTIALKGRSFQMQLVENKLFVGGDELVVFDLKNLTAEGKRPIKKANGKTIQLVDFTKLIMDSQDRLWVLGLSDIYCIDPSTEKVIHTINVSHLAINDWVSCIDISPDKNTIYFNSSRKVYTIDTKNPTAPTEPIINPTTENNAWTVYLMTISKENTIFFIEVRYGSISKGRVYEYDPSNGKEISMFKAGIFPHFIYFE